MSLVQFMTNVNSKRVTNQLKVVERYLSTHVDCVLLVKVYDEGLHIYDSTQNLLILDLNVIS